MSNILTFPTDKVRPAPALAGSSWQPKSRGEVLLFTGIRYMRHPSEKTAVCAAPKQLPEGKKPS